MKKKVLFQGAAKTSLESFPLSNRWTLISRSGLAQLGPPDSNEIVMRSQVLNGNNTFFFIFLFLIVFGL